jgi:hypothetical protein
MRTVCARVNCASLEGYPEAALRLRDNFIARAEHSESDMYRVRRVLEENHGAQ